MACSHERAIKLHRTLVETPTPCRLVDLHENSVDASRRGQGRGNAPRTARTEAQTRL